MEVGEFVAGPCNWDPVAPARLRQQIFQRVSEWRSYSTARFLDGLEPRNLHNVNITGTPFDSSLSVEALSSRITSRLESLGLQFATDRDISDMGFMDTLAKSLDLIRLVPPLHGTVTGVCRSVHALMPPDKDFDVSYSNPSLPFSIFVSCPPLTERNRIERLAENIVHEALHLQLSLVERAEPLVTDGAEEQRTFSPWKQEERTLRGLLHAIYVFSNLCYFWQRVTSDLPKSSSFAQHRTQTINAEIGAATQIVNIDWLTVMGRRLVGSAENQRKTGFSPSRAS